VFCITVICAAYCCVLHANGGLVREESPVFLSPESFSKIDGLTEEDKCEESQDSQQRPSLRERGDRLDHFGDLSKGGE
jgi:hypothetical protein